MKKIFQEHETVTAVLTIILSVFTLNTWLVRDIRQDVKEVTTRIDQLNGRLDQVYHVMMDHITGENK